MNTPPAVTLLAIAALFTVLVFLTGIIIGRAIGRHSAELDRILRDAARETERRRRISREIDRRRHNASDPQATQEVPVYGRYTEDTRVWPVVPGHAA